MRMRKDQDPDISKDICETDLSIYVFMSSKCMG